MALAGLVKYLNQKSKEWIRGSYLKEIKNWEEAIRKYKERDNSRQVLSIEKDKEEKTYS